MPASQDYNAICYAARYPDIRSGYIYAGTDGKWYYQSNLVKDHVVQVKKLSDNEFWHWENFGMAEGRVCGCDLPGTNYSNEFNAAAYLARYPDVRVNPTWKNNPLGHYQQFGIYEGRHPGFEILTSASPVGMVSPGTTTMIADNTDNNITPGDGSVVLNPVDTIATGDQTPVITDNTTDVSTWIAANPLLVAGIVAGALLIMHERKKHKTKRA
jgi:hypothetical protein